MVDAAILLVEDDPHLLELLLETFEDAGYFVQGAAGPDEALALNKKFKFDLVISDVRMAGITDGLGVLHAIKTGRPSIKTIVITGYASEEAPPRAMTLAVDDYIYKPFRLPAMLDTVKRVLRSDAERQGYLGQLSALLLSVPRKILQKAEESMQQSLRAALDGERDKTLQGYYVGMRSKHLTRGAAMEMWDELERWEARYQKLDEGGECSSEAIKELGRGYRQVHEKIALRARAGSIGSLDKRSDAQLSRQAFAALHEQVVAGVVTPEQLKVAFRLRRLGADASKLGPELKSLHQLLSQRG